jgi:excisionase family DNA binding protein
MRGCASTRSEEVAPDDMSSRMSIPEIAKRLAVGRIAVYTMLEQGIIPAIRLGRRWIVTRYAFENWERTCGMPTGLQRRTEHKVT